MKNEAEFQTFLGGFSRDSDHENHLKITLLNLRRTVLLIKCLMNIIASILILGKIYEAMGCILYAASLYDRCEY